MECDAPGALRQWLAALVPSPRTFAIIFIVVGSAAVTIALAIYGYRYLLEVAGPRGMSFS